MGPVPNIDLGVAGGAVWSPGSVWLGTPHGFTLSSGERNPWSSFGIVCLVKGHFRVGTHLMCVRSYSVLYLHTLKFTYSIKTTLEARLLPHFMEEKTEAG